MDVSVVVPLYNKGPHVEAAVASALAQTLAPREVLVIDDGSTDGGRELVEAIGDPRVTLLRRSPPGPGGYAARNLGVERAGGEWVAFLDADDLWRPHHLADMAAAIDACGNVVGGVFTRYEIKEAGRDRLSRTTPDLLAPGPLGLNAILRSWLGTGRCPIWTSACAFRRDLLLEAGLFPAGRARRGGDKDLWLRVAARAALAFAPAVSAEFHQDTVNRVTTSTAHTEPPIIAGTIRSLLPSVTPYTGGLLRRLSNQEVAAYARYATQAGSKVDARFISVLYLPEGLWQAASIAVLRSLRPFLGGLRRTWRSVAAR